MLSDRASFFRGMQTVKDEGHYLSGSTNCQGRFSIDIQLSVILFLGLG